MKEFRVLSLKFFKTSMVLVSRLEFMSYVYIYFFTLLSFRVPDLRLLHESLLEFSLILYIPLYIN